MGLVPQPQRRGGRLGEQRPGRHGENLRHLRPAEPLRARAGVRRGRGAGGREPGSAGGAGAVVGGQFVGGGHVRRKTFLRAASTQLS
jgi:hypothetical protein